MAVVVGVGEVPPFFSFSLIIFCIFRKYSLPMRQLWGEWVNAWWMEVMLWKQRGTFLATQNHSSCNALKGKRNKLIKMSVKLQFTLRPNDI